MFYLYIPKKINELRFSTSLISKYGKNAASMILVAVQL